MRVLLDTNAFLRWHEDSLRSTAIKAIERADIVFVSAVSAWEVAAKRVLGRLRFEGCVEEVVLGYGFVPLDLTMRHADKLLSVPAHHSDPFDRVLIAQALEEGLTIVTSDRAFELYRVPVIWA